MLEQDEIYRRRELVKKIEEGKYPRPKTVTLKKTVEIKKDGKILTQKDVSEMLHGASVAFDIKKGEYARELLTAVLGCEINIKDNSNAVKKYENLMVVYNHHQKYMQSDLKYKFLTGLVDLDDEGNVIWESEFYYKPDYSALHYNDDILESEMYDELTMCFEPAYEKAARRLKEWASHHDISCSESVIQRDAPNLESPELVCELLKILGVIK